MIHVDAQPEPSRFDAEVRQKGLAHLEKKALPLDQPLPQGIEIADYWRACLDDLYASYHATCAYLAVFFERSTGTASVDHFVAKSRLPKDAYEWSNYRLACRSMNASKNHFDDVLDPFLIENGWFHLELVTGRIFPNSALDPERRAQVQATITRLELDDPMHRNMRARHFQGYIEKNYIEDYFKKISPLVWQEAKRQNLL
ncbi:MAG: hypothetical protein HQM03_10890 [Magnetococcales bacterium]|nr:hypothetical protein [Magnetococcales bacterium]